MPTYLARGVSARLGAMPLTNTISSKIILRKGELAKKQAETAERLLQGSKLLDEVPVPLPGDGTQHPLNWLGNAPFIQVQALQDAWGEECSNTTDSPTAASATQEIKALVLHLNLSDRTYVSGLSNKKTSLKIEVFFNGQLSNCWLMSAHDVRSGIRGYHQVFAGTRVDYLAERPWVILPPRLEPDGNFETNHRYVSALQRWQDICQALQIEARERGINKEGEAPPTAEFLKALAAMQIPDQVHNMQKPGGKMFGTVDVIITAGDGRKLTSGVGYLKTPKRMSDENFLFMPQKDSMTSSLQVPHIKQKSSDAERHSSEPVQDLFGPNVDGDCHHEHGSHSKKHALVAGNFSTEGQTGIFSAPELAQPNSHDQTLHHVRQLQVDSARQCTVNPSDSYWDVSQSLHTSQKHSSLWSTPFYTTQGPAISDYSYRRVCQENAAPHSTPLHSFHVNIHDPNDHASTLYIEGNSVDPRQIEPSMLPIPYFSPQRRLHGFNHANLPSPKERMLEAVGGSSNVIQGFTPIPYSVQTAPSLVDHKIPGFPLMPVPSSANQLTWPMPPVGLYSVPKKPDRSTTRRKDYISAQLRKGVHDVFIRRVVILGCNKTILVEHQWDPPMRLRVGLSKSNGLEGQHDLPASINGPSSRPTCRKRKTLHHVAAKKSRNPSGLKTNCNPPLNQGCVIAYAESNGMDSEAAILRQVRSERLGVFREDYVVLATRFFVGEE